jgi:hypothetical protein
MLRFVAVPDRGLCQYRTAYGMICHKSGNKPSVFARKIFVGPKSFNSNIMPEGTLWLLKRFLECFHLESDYNKVLDPDAVPNPYRIGLER